MITLWHNEASPNGAINTVRALTHSLDLSEKRAAVKATQVCSVDGCEHPIRARGFCNGHYKRWHATGDPGSAQIKVLSSADRPCREPDCDRSVGRSGARGWCAKHYVRWKAQGDPQKLGYTRGAERSAQLPHGTAHHQWRGDAAGYVAIHQRIAAQRGRAAMHKCTGCGGQAADWAYDYADPSPAVDEKTGSPYSFDVNRYRPLCKSCHKLADTAQRKAGGSGAD